MIALLDRLIWASISGGIAALFVILLCRVPSIDPRWKVWLCRACYVKLLVSMLSGFAIGVPLLGSGKAGDGTVASSPALFWLAAWLASIWIVGIAVVVRHVWQSIKFARKCGERAIPVDETLRREVYRMAARMGVRRVPELGESALLGQPCVFWFHRPTLLVPDGFEVEEGRHVLAHELAHIGHRDLLWGRLYAVVSALYWFHPLVSRLEREARLWQEASADLAARRTTRVDPREQADAIVTALALLNHRERNNVVALGQYGSMDTVMRRIRALYSERYSPVLALAVLALGLVAMAPLRLVAKETLGKRTPGIATRMRIVDGHDRVTRGAAPVELYSPRLQ